MADKRSILRREHLNDAALSASLKAGQGGHSDATGRHFWKSRRTDGLGNNLVYIYPPLQEIQALIASSSGSSPTWRDPVASFGDLPASGDPVGSVRLNLGDGLLYWFDGSNWASTGGSVSAASGFASALLGVSDSGSVDPASPVKTAKIVATPAPVADQISGFAPISVSGSFPSDGVEHGLECERAGKYAAAFNLYFSGTASGSPSLPVVSGIVEFVVKLAAGGYQTVASTYWEMSGADWNTPPRKLVSLAPVVLDLQAGDILFVGVRANAWDLTAWTIAPSGAIAVSPVSAGVGGALPSGGAEGQVLTVVSGAPAWADPAAHSPLNIFAATPVEYAAALAAPYPYKRISGTTASLRLTPDALGLTPPLSLPIYGVCDVAHADGALIAGAGPLDRVELFRAPGATSAAILETGASTLIASPLTLNGVSVYVRALANGSSYPDPLADLVLSNGGGLYYEVINYGVLWPNAAQSWWFDPEQDSGGVTVHGDLSGLDSDDHVQYLLADGNRKAADGLSMHGFRPGRQLVTDAAYTISKTQDCVIMAGGTVAQVITLPPAVEDDTSYNSLFIVTNLNTNGLTLQTSGSDNIHHNATGTTTLVVPLYSTVMIYGDGIATWRMLQLSDLFYKLTEKTSFVAGDTFILEDSANSNIKKRLSGQNLSDYVASVMATNKVALSKLVNTAAAGLSVLGKTGAGAGARADILASTTTQMGGPLMLRQPGGTNTIKFADDFYVVSTQAELLAALLAAGNCAIFVAQPLTFASSVTPIPSGKRAIVYGHAITISDNAYNWNGLTTKANISFYNTVRMSLGANRAIGINTLDLYFRTLEINGAFTLSFNLTNSGGVFYEKKTGVGLLGGTANPSQLFWDNTNDSSGGTSFTCTYKYADYTIQNSDGAITWAAAGTGVFTLPPSPTDCQTHEVYNMGTGNLTIDRNAKEIWGQTNNLVVPPGTGIKLRYVAYGASANTWVSL